ncbi:DUF3037 domain-containing protein [Flavobacterium hauense]
MKTNFYKYSILKYSHSPFLDESINIGLLIYFNNNSKFSFYYSKNLSRIKCIYNNVPEKVVKEYLKHIDKRLKSFDIRNDIFQSIEIDNLNDFLTKYILPKDGYLLRFSECKTNSQYDFENDFIEETLLKNHFIDDLKLNSNLPKEPELAEKFFKNIKSLDLNEINRSQKRFYKDFILKNDTGNEFKFDYAWQNGTLNLVKPISFDLKESKSIADKAYRNLGQFIDLENEAEKKNLRYDLILGKPSSKSLFKEYDHAVHLLEKIKHASLIEEDKIQQYSLKAIKAITEDIE